MRKTIVNYTNTLSKFYLYKDMPLLSSSHFLVSQALRDSVNTADSQKFGVTCVKIEFVQNFDSPQEPIFMTAP